MAHVKRKAEWKKVNIEEIVDSKLKLDGFISLEELTDYEIVTSLHKQGDSTEISNKKRKDNKQKDVLKKKKRHDEDNVVLPKSQGKKKKEFCKETKKHKTEKKRKGIGKMISSKNVVDIGQSDMMTEEPQTPGKNIESPARHKQKYQENVENRKISEEHERDHKEYFKTDLSAWNGLFVPQPVLRAFDEMGFNTPMPIQVLTLPSAIRDKMDIVGAAETGSGKTLAFGIPLIHRILDSKKSKTTSFKKEPNPESICDIDDENEQGVIMGLGESDSDQENPVIDTLKIRSKEGKDVTDSEDTESEEEENVIEDNDDDSPDKMGCVKILTDVEFDWLPKPHINTDEKLHSLILTPTRELAMQVKDHLLAAAKFTDIKVAAIVGGMAPQKQRRLLKRKPEIVVATPGRLWELIQEGDPHLSTISEIKCLVIDEADRMIEKGHFEELTKLLERINADETQKAQRQTFVFSATLTLVHSGPQRHLFKKKKFKMTQKLKLDMLMEHIGIKEKPKIIDLTQKSMGTAESLVEAKIMCSVTEKDVYMYYFLTQYPGRTLVFANSKDCVRRLVSIFILLGCNPLSLHADMHQKQRLKSLERFTGNERGLLLATDVAARGLDIPNVQHVIHYQVPRTTENYVHRSGRTARASKEGLSIMLVSADDMKNYRKIIKTLNRDEDLPTFPVEMGYIKEVKRRVQLAREIDTAEHRMIKAKKKNDWFTRTAKEMDIEIDDEQLLDDVGDSAEQSEQRQRHKHMRAELTVLLRQSLMTQGFSGKYPTKMGKLVLPSYKDESRGSAMTIVKHQKRDISSTQLDNKIIKHKKKKYVRKKKHVK